MLYIKSSVYSFYSWTFVPFDQHLSFFPIPRPGSTIILVSVSLSLALLLSTYKWYHTVFAFLYQTYLTSYSAPKEHPCCCKRQDVLLSLGWVIVIYIYMYSFIHPSLMNTCYFHLLAIVNKAVMHIGFQLFLQDPVFFLALSLSSLLSPSLAFLPSPSFLPSFLPSFNIHPKVGFLTYMVVLLLISWGISKVFHGGCTNIHSCQEHRGFPFLHIVTNACYVLSFKDSHSNRCNVVSHCECDLHFCDDCDLDNFSYRDGHLHMFLEKNVYSGFLSISKSDCLGFFYCCCLLSSSMSFYRYWIITPYQIHDSQTFPLIPWLPFHAVDGFICCAEAF